MRTVRGWVGGFVRFWYHFLIGDDWAIAVGVALALGATYGLFRTGVPAWWLMPIGAVAVLVTSVIRANRRT